MRYVDELITAPTTSAPSVAYDDGANPFDFDKRPRIVVTFTANKNVTVKTYWAQDGASQLQLRSTDSYTSGAVNATRNVTVVAVASLVNNDYLTVTDGTTTVIFEYKVNGSFAPTAGRTTIDVSALTTDVEVAVATAAAITAADTKITCPVPTTATLTATADVSGPLWTVGITENVANAGYTVGSLTAGTNAAFGSYDKPRYAGRNKIVLEVASNPTEFQGTVSLSADRSPTV